jgi:hypothetical protein
VDLAVGLAVGMALEWLMVLELETDLDLETGLAM